MKLNTIEMLERLVGFPTISAASNLELIDFVEKFLFASGFSCERFPDPTGKKAALFASSGPGYAGGLLLSAHSDVVPVDGQAWTSDAFRLVEREWRLYGRGSADMKGFLASMLVVAARTSGCSLAAPLHLAISYDEEVGCRGVRPMLDEIAKRGLKPRLCVVGEPTRMRVAVGHKGKLILRATCSGTAAHSASAPRALNAIHLAGDLLTSIRRLQAEVVSSGDRDPAYDIPYTTLHVGLLNGGKTLNIVPDHAALDFEIRHLVSDNPDAIVSKLTQSSAAIVAPYLAEFVEAAIEIQICNRSPGLDTPTTCREVMYLKALLAEADTIKVDFGTEAGLFQERLEVPTVVCGPGSMDQGHKADEYIERSQIAQCDHFLHQLVAGIIK